MIKSLQMNYESKFLEDKEELVVQVLINQALFQKFLMGEMGEKEEMYILRLLDEFIIYIT